MLKTLLAGGLVVGALDLIDAFVFFGVRNGTPPVRILYSIASGVLGRAAFQGGTRPAVLGAFLQFLIATLIVLTAFVLVRLVPLLGRHVIAGGIAFGLGAYLVMNFVVIPLSASTRGALVLPVVLNGLAIHAFGVGIPAVWFASRAARQR